MQPAIKIKHADVRVAANDAQKVIAVSVAGRPKPHPFGGYEGSHLTPWAVQPRGDAAIPCSTPRDIT
jgi:hypothetical protein